MGIVRVVMNNAIIVHNKSVLVLLVLCTVLIVAPWLIRVQVASGSHVNSGPVTVRPLFVPSGFAAAEPDPDTAFREEDAGLSAYLRVGPTQGSGSQPRLNIRAIVDALTSTPEASQLRGTGELVDWGLNFGIVELPMSAAVISPAPVENVTVYFDNDGWVVAYLPHDRPAAALWKYDSADGPSASDPKADQHLVKNLLVIAINEVMIAEDQGTATVDPSEVNYYDWTCPRCDTFALFSGVSKAGVSDEIKFVIPYTISLVRSSAAVVITEPVQQGGSVTATAAVDGKVVVTANANHLLNSDNFSLDRDVESTSLHRVVVESPDDNVVAGAIALLYDRP